MINSISIFDQFFPIEMISEKDENGTDVSKFTTIVNSKKIVLETTYFPQILEQLNNSGPNDNDFIRSIELELKTELFMIIFETTIEKISSLEDLELSEKFASMFV